MAEENKIEDVLDRDYLFLISFAKTYYPYVTGERNKVLCDQWLTKLCSERAQGVSPKRNRNTFLAYFLMNLQEGKMRPPFAQPPEDGPLPSARDIFAPPEAAQSSVSEEEADLGEEPEEFQERSADGRTYVAVRCLPDGKGTYAFVALNLDKEDDESKDLLVVPCATDRAKLRHVKALHRLATGNSLGSHPSESQMEDFYMRNIETKVSGDISQLYESLSAIPGKPCGRNKSEVAYFDVLLSQIDEEIKGVVTGDNDLVRFMVTRMGQDLKKMPKMAHLFDLTPEQRHLKLLEILRQKLVVRYARASKIRVANCNRDNRSVYNFQAVSRKIDDPRCRQQEEKRRNLLAEMEEKMAIFGRRSECCMDRSDEPTNSMWQLAVTKPLADADMQRLFDAYPEDSIGTFLDLLADDRQVILQRGNRRQRKAIESMRSEVYKEVQAGKAEYNKARAAFREWNDILSIVEEMMYEAGNRALEEDSVPDEEPRQNEALLANMIANVKETENLVIEEARRAEILTEKIADANMWTFSIQDDKGRDSSWEIKSAIENSRREIESCKLLIEKQHQRIEELRSQLDYE